MLWWQAGCRKRMRTASGTELATSYQSSSSRYFAPLIQLHCRHVDGSQVTYLRHSCSWERRTSRLENFASNLPLDPEMSHKHMSHGGGEDGDDATDMEMPGMATSDAFHQHIPPVAL